MRNPFREQREYREAKVQRIREACEGLPPCTNVRKRPPTALWLAWFYITILGLGGGGSFIYYAWPKSLLFLVAISGAGLLLVAILTVIDE